MKHGFSSLLTVLLVGASVVLPTPALAGPKPAPHAKSENEVILKENSAQDANLKIEPVTEVLASTTEPLNGKISFDENYTSRISSPVLGRAIKVQAQPGDRVKAGQALLTIDSPDLGSALADYRKANADLDLKRKALERSKLLLDGGVIAHKEYESAQSDMAQSQAEATRTKSRLHNLGIDHAASNESFTLKAPMAGMVVDRQINVGNEVRPDAPSPLFIITNPDHLWAIIDLPERDLNKVSLGQALSIKVDAYPDDEFQGKVQSIGTMLDPVSRRVQVRCSVESKGKLRPEMYAKVTPLNMTQQKVIRIPNSALITEGLYSFVFVETSHGHIQKRRVTLDLQGRDYATIKDGLKAGERVVTKGAILINSELAADK
nr:efflux RND transporter periplasmic adaptor subunit [uncultured Methylotenera sp.]